MEKKYPLFDFHTLNHILPRFLERHRAMISRLLYVITGSCSVFSDWWRWSPQDEENGRHALTSHRNNRYHERWTARRNSHWLFYYPAETFVVAKLYHGRKIQKEMASVLGQRFKIINTGRIGKRGWRGLQENNYYIPPLLKWIRNVRKILRAMKVENIVGLWEAW